MPTDPIPDQFCPHIQEGLAEMAGGWYFAANVPPIAVGMCSDCLRWCHRNLSTPETWVEYTERQERADDLILSSQIIDG